MSKRKRKKKNTKPQSSQSNGDSKPGRTTGTSIKPAKSQRGLLWLALALMAIAAIINARRLTDHSLQEPLALPTTPVVSRPLTSPSQPSGKTRFTELPPAKTGISFTHPVIEDHPLAHLYFSSPASGGTAIGDVNNDGRPDIFIASGPSKNRLYLQTETPFEFTDATETAGVNGGNNWSCGATMVDINADGRLDIFVANYDTPNQLFINLGDGSFADQAVAYRLNMTDASLEGAFADYDRDGDLDLYLLTYRYENPDGMPAAPPIVTKDGKRTIHPDLEKYYVATNDKIGYSTVGRSDNLLRNNGDGTFSNVTVDAGIYGPGHGQSVTWWDFDQDGYVDLHIGNDFNDPDRLYHNNGDGTFTDVVRDYAPHTTWYSMGADVGDVDGDGMLDLMSADMSSTTHFKQKTTMGAMGTNAKFLATASPRQYMRNALLLNSKTNRFREAAYLAGLESTDWTWSVKLADWDCDGLLDAFFTNGSVRSFTDSDRVLTLSQRRGKTDWDIYKDTEPLREANLVFQNQGKLAFRDQSKAWGLDHVGVSMSAAQGDLDGDGDLDLVVANVEEPVTVYRNDTLENQRVTLRLHGRDKNRFATGAIVRAIAPGGSQIAELQPTRGFLSSNQPLVHFGCGDATTVDLEITWPDGSYQQIGSLATNHHYEITQPAISHHETQEATDTWFETQSLAAELAHHENEFDDYALQPLLPHRMSALGPAAAVGDVDGDGQMDLFLGGAAGKPGQVARWSTNENKYTRMQQPALLKDQSCEDMGAIWLDVDGDGHTDLLVASGGNEHPVDSAAFQPRLYMNDGMGKLTRAVDWLPELRISAGPLAAADFDDDGDTDVFVGGRQVPGKYPLPASSYLLVNTGSEFEDGSSTCFANRLNDLGMVTGAIWSDTDLDGDLDLLVTLEWDSIRLFRNDGGKFIDASAEAGLTPYRGWWTGITAADVDNDGDFDYVATNLGLNTKYHASDEKPFRIYYGDFEGNGTPSLVEAEYEADKLFPVRGKSCSTHAIPSLGNKFKTYKQFAAATLQEIYTPQRLDESYQCSANFLSSVILRNDGKGHFDFIALPVEAQLAPTFGTATCDFNGDGNLDLFLAQNFHSPQPETGNMDGGLGCLLQGAGDGTFASVSPSESGIVVPQDAMAVVTDVHRSSDGARFLVTTNNDAPRTLTATKTAPQVVLRFPGARSSSEIAGARIQIQFDDNSQQNFEVAAGSGYLSQQPPVIVFSNPKNLSGRIRLTLGAVTKGVNFSSKEREIRLDLSNTREKPSP